MATRRVFYDGNCKGVSILARRFGAWKDKKDVACFMQVSVSSRTIPNKLFIHANLRTKVILLLQT